VTGDEYVLALPGPSRRMLLSANQRLHWAERGRRTAYWRDLAGHALLAERRALGLPNPAMRRAHVVVTLTWPDHARRDVGNYSPTAKALVDGLVDAGWLPDDSDDHLTGPDLRRAHGPWGITLTITPEATP
jgi:crossover junction endodeoxyribonuclease RusA